MLNRKALLFVFCCLILSTISPLLYGQATGSFSGTVSDKTGSVIAGATVRVTSQGTAPTREAKTDDTGHYLIPLVPIGNYTIRVEVAGLSAHSNRGTSDCRSTSIATLDFPLAPASVTSTVEVSATRSGGGDDEPDSRTSDHVRAGGRSASERPRLRAVGHADARDHAGNEPQQLLQRRPEQRSFNARVIFAIGGRIPRQQYRLVASTATTTTN